MSEKFDPNSLNFTRRVGLDPSRYITMSETNVLKEVDDQLKFHPEAAEHTGVTYLRDRNRKVVYKQTTNGYECVTCSSEIQQVASTRSIHDGPFDDAGSGRVWTERIPYCPRCEQPPETSEAPIRIKGI